MGTIRTSVAAFLAAFLIQGCGTSPEVTSPANKNYHTYVHVGQTMPVLSFASIDGEAIDLTASDKPKLVVLFATWCSDSQRFLKQLSHSPLATQDKVQIVTIGREETTLSLQSFKREFGLDFTMVADEDRSIYRQFANAGIPRVILLDGDNQIVKTLIGEDPDTLDKVVW